MTWKEEVDAYQTWLGTRHETNEGRKVGANYLRYSGYLLKRLGKNLHPSSFRDLTKDDVTGWVSDLRKGGLSEASIYGYMGMVKAFLRHLNGGETPPCLQGLSFSGGSKSRVKSYDDLTNDDELEKVLSILALDRRTVVRLIRNSGCRPGEALGVRRKDARIVTKEGREFVVLSFPKTKTGQPRSAVVSDPKTIETLKEYLAYAPESKWLFPAPTGDRPLPYQTLWRTLERACKKAGVRHIFPYQLRHTWASKEGARMPSHIRSRQMGTKSETIMNHYDHVSAEGLLEAHLELGGGRPVVTDGVVAVKDILERIDALAEKDARIKALVEEALEALPAFKVSGGGNPVARTEEILVKLVDALGDGGE